ncbi:MAG: bifunctional phosphopantothenoylcysteine decarboxylase/phosphopantothenate--cysteine ligase CoaBC [Gemmatimonadetes bacterium]|nr:bifunctional phosphopantothenoylcysteine decarboxylase/phosphopantothenate--cysteine ligase CoaBC [Gemmatimonadota bacterium]
MLSGRHVVLGVSGGIASYKACILARRLAEAGADVQVVLTAAAAEFVGPVTFEALTGKRPLTSLWEPGSALAHVDLARDADLVILAPATAHLLARAAQGLADDLLTALLLARSGPVLCAPAMNDRMFAHPATQENLRLLARRGWRFVGPATGPLAEGESDQPGRMSEPEEIFAWAERQLRSGGQLTGRRVVVTAGPTREALDPVRVLTNRSSGRMGYALAAAAFSRGADVLLISGPTQLPPPYGVETRRIETTRDLERAVAAAVREAHVLMMAAAPADFAPARRHAAKRPRADGAHTLTLEATPDVLAGTRSRRRKGCVCVGFALETGDGIHRAREKLEAKALHMVVLNHADQAGAGPEVETNRATLVTREGTEALPLLPKREVAERIWNTVESLL